MKVNRRIVTIVGASLLALGPILAAAEPANATEASAVYFGTSSDGCLGTTGCSTLMGVNGPAYSGPTLYTTSVIESSGWDNPVDTTVSALSAIQNGTVWEFRGEETFNSTNDCSGTNNECVWRIQADLNPS